MRILYAIQGTGNGHIARSIQLIDKLKEHSKVDILVSGLHNEISIPYPIKYCPKGMGFIFGKSGGIDYTQTYKKNSIFRFFREVKSLPISKYNLVISDFEPVSVRAARRCGIPTLGISNQAALFHQKLLKPSHGGALCQLLMKHYAPCDANIGLHYESTGKWTETPIIRNEIREGIIKNEGFGVVYLPAHSDEAIVSFLQHFPQRDWFVFSKRAKHDSKFGNITIQPVNVEKFNSSILSCDTVITAAGFGTTTEVLHLGKKLCVIPMKKQLEQTFNAKTLESLGATVLQTQLNEEAIAKLTQALEQPHIKIHPYPDNTDRIIHKIYELNENLQTHALGKMRVKNAVHSNAFTQLSV